jgi:hypothetical protein
MGVLKRLLFDYDSLPNRERCLALKFQRLFSTVQLLVPIGRFIARADQQLFLIGPLLTGQRRFLIGRPKALENGGSVLIGQLKDGRRCVRGHPLGDGAEPEMPALLLPEQENVLPLRRVALLLQAAQLLHEDLQVALLPFPAILSRNLEKKINSDEKNTEEYRYIF